MPVTPLWQAARRRRRGGHALASRVRRDRATIPGRCAPPLRRARSFMYHPDLIRHPDSCPTLVLNADYTPLSYYPLSVWPWQTAIKAVFLDRVDIVAEYEREGRSPPRSLKLPSVIALKSYVRPS